MSIGDDTARDAGSPEWTESFLQRATELMVASVPEKLGEQDPATGRFLTPYGGWHVTRQDVMFPLAYLWAEPRKGNPYHRDDRVLAAIREAGRALRDAQDEDGQVEFVKADGSTWGQTYMPWSMYHWLETFDLVSDGLPGEEREEWEEGLSLAFNGISTELGDHVHNIPVWNAMSLYRAAEVFDRDDWARQARDFLHEAAAAQDPAGYWAEHDGPTTSYNRVYVHAFGVYYALSGDEAVLDALRRALDFHLHFTYPDGSNVETIDGRVKYDAEPSPSGVPGFLPFERGRRYVSERLLRAADPGWGLSPHLASACLYVSPEPVSAGADEPAVEADVFRDYRQEYRGLARLNRNGPWFNCLSQVTVPRAESRWGMDRQSFVSVWHEDVGLLVGGGNSKDQPLWSNFEFRPEGDEEDEEIDRRHVPDTATVESDGAADSVILGVGDHRGRISVRSTSDREAEVSARWLTPAADARAEWHLPLYVKPGAEIGWGPADGWIERYTRELDANTLQGPVWITGDYYREGDVEEKPVGEGPAFRLWVDGEWSIDLPPGAVFTWPSRPFNPYASDGRAPVSEALGVVLVPLEEEPVTCRLRVEEG